MSEPENPTAKSYASFEEFWPDYVRAHANKTNRQLHFVGTTLAVACLGGALLFRRRSLLLAAPLAGYGLAWVGHYVFEKNTPATFSHPIYSLKGDFVMWAKMATGTMDAELAKYVPVAEAEATPAAAEGEKPAATNGVAADVTVN